YGDSIGTLNIYLFDGSYTRIWSLSGSHGNQWYEGQVSYVSLVPHEIVVEGIAGNDYLGGISVDDFTFTISNCSIRPMNNTVPTIGTTLLSTQLTITTPYTSSPTTSYTDPLTTTTRLTTTASIGILTTTTDITQINPTTSAECAQYVCYNDGICKPSSTQLGQTMCECKPGFNGPKCENKESSSTKNNLGAILGGVFGGVAAIALSVVGYMYFSSKKRIARVANTSSQLTDPLQNDSNKNPTYNETAVVDA
ncbi:unnamed protein product, partial [Rotaria sp. Silwood2]